MTTDELAAALVLHRKWVANEDGGKRADLSGADLRYADLRYADLSDAYLGGANLRCADLRYADLRYAELRYADLSDAYLSSANLSDANLSGANLSGANLNDANLSGANLSDANLICANLIRAMIDDRELTVRQIVPQEGEFVGYKQLRGGVIAKLRIVGYAERVGGVIGRKCRASAALVLSLEGLSGEIHEVGQSHADESFFYRVGAIVRPIDSFNNDRRIECASGIHFFLTREEAEAY